jgi:hypothetical protein
MLTGPPDGLAAPPSSASIAGCPVFPSDNVWNTRIDSLPVHARSAAWVSSIGNGTGLKADFGSGLWEAHPIGIPYTTVPANQPTVTVAFDPEAEGENDLGPYRVPPNAPIEGGSDHHVLVVDRDNCKLMELFDARKLSDTSWAAYSGAIFDLNSHTLRTAGWTSADAAGLPIFPGLVRFDEVLTGEIAHALRFTAVRTQRAYLWPARHYASTITDPNVPPMGARVRLKASVDISGYSPQIRVILTALKRYGMFLADNGSNWYMSGVPDSGWNNDMLRQLGNIKGSDMEFVDESGLMIAVNSGQARQTSPAPTATQAPPTATPTPRPTNTPTMTSTPRPSCVPRPAAWTNVVRSAADQFAVTIGAGTGSGAPNNRLRAVRIGAPVNGTIRFNGQLLNPGTRVPFPNGTQQATFMFFRTAPGQATTVPMVIEDECGDWPTFVGAGPAA